MKTETISFKVSKEEKEQISQAAKSSNLSLSNYLLQAAKEKMSGNNLSGELPKHICKIINNIDNLTRFEQCETKDKLQNQIYTLEDYFINSYNNSKGDVRS